MIYYGLLLFFLLEYVRPSSFVPGLEALRLNSLIPLAVVLGTLFTRKRFADQDASGETNNKTLVLLLCVFAISVVMCDVQTRALDVFKTVFSYALIYWVIIQQVTNRERLKGVFKVLTFVHVVVVALSPEMLTDPTSRSHYLASGSFLGDGNDFALSVNIVLPLCLFLFLDATKVRHKLLYLAALLFLVICIVATMSRGGTIALGCVGLYFWLKSNRKAMTGAIVIAVVGLILLYAPASYYERMGTIRNNTEDGSAQARLTAWRVSFRMALDNPLFGVGAGHFPTKFVEEYLPPGFDRAMTAHSIYFLALGELGFPGLLLLIFFIVSNLAANRRQAVEIRTRDPGTRGMDLLLASTSAALIAYASGGAFLSALNYPHLYVLAGLLTAARRLAREPSEVSQTRSPAPSQNEVFIHWALRRPAAAGPIGNLRPTGTPGLASHSGPARRLGRDSG